MHEITKYFLFTENQKQCLNPSYRSLTGPVRSVIRHADLILDLQLSTVDIPERTVAWREARTAAWIYWHIAEPICTD